MQNSRPIGVFDSGLGGLSVLGELKKLLPNEDFIYFGDNANVPYGEKSKETLVSFSKNILNYFKSRNVKMALMACNTSSAVTLSVVKDDYDFDVLGLIEPTAQAIAKIDAKSIGIIATSATIKSEAYKKTIQKYADKEVFQMACPGLVEIVEEGRIQTPEAKELVKKYIAPLLEKNVEKIVLGCTHYPFLGEIIKDLAQNDDILINPAEFLAAEAFRTLQGKNLLSDSTCGSVEFFTSTNPEDFKEVGQNLYPEFTAAVRLELNS